MATFFKTLFTILASLIVSIVILCGVIIGVIFGAAAYFAPTVKAPQQGTLLEINLGEEITDSPRILPLFNMRKMSIEQSSPLSLLSVMRALEAAAADPNITAISLRMDGEYHPPLALAEELRDALQHFKKSSGKPIYAYSQSYSQSSYYLSCVADSIFLEPLGAIEWQGVATASYYYGDLLHKLGIGVEAFRPRECSHKSAIEPYTLSSQSPESKEQSQRLVDELWRGVVGQVAVNREIEPQRLRHIASQEVMVNSSQAKSSGMIDSIAYYDQYESALERLGVMRNKRGNLRRVTLSNYSLLQQQDELSSGGSLLEGSPKIGIIYADGVIMGGKSERGNDPTVGSESICRELRVAKEDKDIKAVILRVNSPGGSALAADVMWREVERLREEKPVVVSMGSYAASGGYYISAPSDIIIANRYTLTGSIGVYSLTFNYAETLSKNLNINIDGVGSEPSADFGRTPRRLNTQERAAMEQGVNEVYESFTEKVAEGRNMPKGVVSTLAGGRVWSGVEAESCGLVDAVGGLRMALAVAIDRSNLTEADYKVVEIEDDKDGLDAIFSMIGLQIQELLNIGITDGSNAVRQLKRIESAERGLIMHSPERVL